MADAVLEKVNFAFKSGYTGFKPKQKECVLNATENDVLCVLPTGYGKTLIIQSLLYLSAENSTVIVVNGLKSIIDEQTTKFGQKCIVVDECFVKGLDSTSELILNRCLFL